MAGIIFLIAVAVFVVAGLCYSIFLLGKGGQVKSRNNVLLFLLVFLVFAGVVATAFWGMYSGKELPHEATQIFGYFIGIVFMAIGVLGIFLKIQMKQKVQDLIALPGVQVDYRESESMSNDGDSVHTVKVYHPIYEYEWGGERKRICGPVGASGKKYRTIGRQVQILVDPRTGKAICAEDERAMHNWFLVFGIIGAAVFALMLALHFGVISS